MAKALINGRVLRWARERASLPADVVAARLNQDADRLTAWEEGLDQPTFRQAQHLASVVHVPFGYLFLAEPPSETLELPDLRTVGGEPADQLDVNFRDLLNDLLLKHAWFVETLKEGGAEPLPFVGSASVDSDPVVTAKNIRQVLGTDASDAANVQTWEDHLRALIERTERVGIWTMRSGIVGSNTHRPLSVHQFRGLAISDPIAPLVFLNGRDATAAQIFTLIHEVAHIWIGQSGISNVKITATDYGTHRKVERFCNAVAAEFLVPRDALMAEWRDELSDSTNYDLLARRYKVSRIVVARRAFDLGKTQVYAFRSFATSEEERWAEDASDNSSGGNFWNTLPIRNGRRFTSEVASRAASGQLLLREAASLLNVQPALVVEYFRAHNT